MLLSMKKKILVKDIINRTDDIIEVKEILKKYFEEFENDR